MKLDFDTKKLSRKQIAFAASITSLIVGFSSGWFLGRHAVRSEIKESISSAFGGLNNNSDPPSAKSDKPKVIDGDGNEILDTMITTDKDPLTDATQYTLIVISDNKIQKSYGSERTALVFKCKSKDTNVYFTTANFAPGSDGTDVKIRWDDGGIKQEYYGPATGGGAFFSGAPKSFLNKAISSSKVVLSYDTYDRNETAIFKFDKQNKKDLGKMKDYCN